MHDISVLDHIFFAFHAQHAAGAAGGLVFVAHVVLIGDDLGADEAAFKVRMNNPGRLRSLPALVNGPCAHFLRADRKVAAKSQSFVAGANNAHKTALVNAVRGQHFGLLGVGKALQFFFQLGTNAGKTCLSPGGKGLEGFHKGIAFGHSVFVHVGAVNNRLGCQKAQFAP